MKTEFEAKFLRVNHDDVRRKLEGQDARLVQPMRLMRRVFIETPEMRAKGAFLRVRDEGDKVTLTYKQFDELSIDGAKEHEVEISDYQTTIDLLAAAGLPYRSIQESRRETWMLDGCEVVLDEWPWLSPSFIEIEGESEEQVRRAAAKLGFSWDEADFGDVMVAYRDQYSHLAVGQTIGHIPAVRFGDPLPELLQDI